jgi:hypothetical protein
MTDLTQDLAALDAALYMGPTPDPWQASRPDSEGDVTVAGPGGVPIAKCGHATSVLDENHAYVIGYCEAIANARFIAACSPDRIRRLLDYIRGLARDAARYRWLRKGESDDVAVVRGLGAMDYGMSAVVYTYSEEIDGDDLDAAIDAAIDRARGKEAT